MRLALPIAALALTAACATPEEPHDYSLFLDHTPRSILVLPPMNDSMDVEATEIHLATITRPLAERGYYVFPVAVVEQLMRENGLPTAWEMHQVSLAKIDEIIGADAVLYLTITDWGTSFQVIDSTSQVAMRGRLVDVKTGLVIWEGQAELEEHSSGGGADPISMVLVAVINQIADSTISPPDQRMSREIHYSMIREPEHGLLLGPRHPDYESSRQVLRQSMAEREVAPASAGEEGGD